MVFVIGLKFFNTGANIRFFCYKNTFLILFIKQTRTGKRVAQQCRTHKRDNG